MSDEPPSQMIRVPTPLVGAVRELARLHRQGRTKAVLEGIERLIAAIDSETDIDSVTKTISKLTERLERLEAQPVASGTDIDIGSVSNSISNLNERLEKVDTRLEKVDTAIDLISVTMTSLNVRVSDLEGVDNITSTAESKDSSFDITSTAGLATSADSSNDSNLTSPIVDIITDSNSTAEVDKQVDIAADNCASSEAEFLPQFPNPLSQSALARRLGISDKAIQKQREKGKENFAEWSRERDPDSITWTWEGRGGRGQPLRFVPLGYDALEHDRS